MGSCASNSEAGGPLANGCQQTNPGPGGLGADRVSFGTATNLCEVSPKDRVDCGYPEITSEQCNNRGCCFDSSIPGVIWCFKPLQDTGEPPRLPGILPGSPEATHVRAGHPTPWLSIGGGLSQRSRAQGLSPAVLLPSGLCRL